MSQKKEYERIMVPSIHDIPGVQAKAAFLIDSGSVFREQKIDAISSIKREGYGIIFRLKLEILKHQSASFLN